MRFMHTVTGIRVSDIKECTTHVTIHHNNYPMNKADIIAKVQDTLGTTKADAERAVDCVFDSIMDAMKSGQQVSVAGFGIFEAPMYDARQARNPRTGEMVDVPAMRRPKFRAAKALKDAVK